MYVYLWPIHVDVWQKPTQYCKAIILQLKIDKLKKKKKTPGSNSDKQARRQTAWQQSRQETRTGSAATAQWPRTPSVTRETQLPRRQWSMSEKLDNSSKNHTAGRTGSEEDSGACPARWRLWSPRASNLIYPVGRKRLTHTHQRDVEKCSPQCCSKWGTAWCSQRPAKVSKLCASLQSDTIAVWEWMTATRTQVNLTDTAEGKRQGSRIYVVLLHLFNIQNQAKLTWLFKIHTYI